MAIINGTGKADKLKGTNQIDLIYGGNGDDSIDGAGGSDLLFGGNGNDLISGGAGSDVIDGGNGQDTLVLSGNRADYRIQSGPFGTVTVRDLRAGSPDGTDIILGIERVQFKNGTFKLQELLAGNAAPVAQNDALTLAETAGKTEVTSILLANDSDPDGDAIVVSAVQAVSAQGAAVSIGPDGKVSYDAGSIFADLDNGETATDSFSYTITDGNGHVSTATATVTITGVSQNEAPVAAGDELELAEDAGATDVTDQLLANDSDPDGDVLAVGSVQAVSDMGASVTVSADGKVSYDAGDIFAWLNEGETATDSFTYTITDGNGHTSTATATVTITGVTQAPPEPDAYFYIAEDATRDDLLEKLSDWLEFPITGAHETASTLGTVHFGGGVLSFTADDPYSDRLNYDQRHETTFTVTGANGETKTVMAIIEGVNDAVVAVDDHVSVGEGGETGNLYKSVVANEIDPDGSPHWNEILSVGTAGTQGTVWFDASSRTLTYSAAGIDLDPGETFVDSFTYVVDDSFDGIDTGTVFVTVTGNEDGSVSTSMAGGESMMAAFAPPVEAPGEMPSWDLGQAQTILGADAYIA